MLTAPTSERHIVPLDGLRGIAVLLVMFGHFWLVQKPVNAVESAVFTFFQNGWIGVDLFFALSGFLITGILLEAKGAKHYFRNFYARRVLRIFPLYWGFLFVYFAVLPHVVSLNPGSPYAVTASTTWWFWTYMSNMLSIFPAVVPLGLNHFWSLAVEEQFYLIWPAIVLLLDSKSLEKTIYLLIVGAFLFRCFLFFTPYHHTGGFVLLPARIDTLAIGAWLAIVYRDPARREWAERMAPRAFLIALVVLAAVSLPSFRILANMTSMQTIGFPLLAAMGVSLIAIAAGKAPRTDWVRGVFSSRLLVVAGKYSYAMYVLHLPLVIAMDTAGLHMRTFSTGNPPGVLAAFAYSIVASILTFMAAFASWHLYEKHFLKLKRLFPRRPEVACTQNPA